MKIALCTDTYLHNPNGISSAVYLLKRELELRGDEVWVIAPSAPGTGKGEDGVLRVPSVPYPPYSSLRVASPFTRVSFPTVDIVHNHTPFGVGLLGVRLARRFGVPHISTLHTDYFTYTHYVPLLTSIQRQWDLVSMYLRLAYGSSDLLIAPSSYARGLLERSGFQNRIEIVPGGIDPALLSRTSVELNAWPSGKLKILVVARLSIEKRLDVILRSVSLVPESHLVIVGEGPLKRELGKLISALGIKSRVSMVGTVPLEEMGNFYRQADVLVSSSRNETQGLAICEAQSMGLAVVAADTGGGSENIIDEETGLLATSDNDRSFAHQITRLSHDPALRRRLGDNARRASAAKSIALHTESIRARYVELLDQSLVSDTKTGD